MQVNIANGFYESDSLPSSNMKCNNWRVNIPQTEGALSFGELVGTEGIDFIITSGLVLMANRGSHEKAGLPYFVNGETLYRLDRTIDANGIEVFALASLGTIPGTATVSFADNGKQLIIVAGGLGWIQDETVSPTITAITDPAFTSEGVPQQVVFIDSFFILTLDSDEFLRSAAKDGLSWSALDKFTAEADPDDIVAPIVLKNQLLIAGSQTIEPFQDIAGQFQRINGAVINKGVFSPFGIANTSDSVMFIGGGVNESPAIWSISGNSAQKISTTAIDVILARMPKEEIDTATAYSYAKSGAFIVGFSFDARTFEFNTINSKWNERTSKITDARGLVLTTKWRANSVVTAYNRVLVGDAIDGRIGSLNPDTYDEYGFAIVREFSTAPFQNEMKSFSISEAKLTMEAGVGTEIMDPVIRMSYSKDGKTFNNELWRGIGYVGEFERVTNWRKLGRFTRMGVLNYTMSDPVKPTVIRLDVKIRGSNGN